jgi:hypothetical protein
MAPDSLTTSPHPIHLLHRLFFLWIEPILAFGGVIQVLTNPLSYIAISHPLLHDFFKLHPSLAAPLEGGIFTVIAGGWAIMVFNDAVTLRAFQREPKVWWYVIAAHLCSDLCYVAALAHDVGGWGRSVNVAEWTQGEWVTNVLTWPGLAAKVAVLCGIGVDCGYGKIKTG